MTKNTTAFEAKSPFLFVFIALACEAKPLIRYWHLKKHPQKHPFGIYCHQHIVLVVSGVGKLAMAGAVAYTMALFRSTRFPLLLNIGIAGHQNFDIGSIHLAHKVVDEDTGKKFYPQNLPGIGLASQTLKTRSKPDSSYDEKFLYDMEAAGFYEMAIKFSSLESIHCLKIISDNSQSSQENIDEQKVDDWIERQLPVVTEVVEQLSRVRRTIILPDCSVDFEQLDRHYHLTASNTLKIKILLERRRLLKGNDVLNWNIGEANSVKDLLARLEKEMTEIDFFL